MKYFLVLLLCTYGAFAEDEIIKEEEEVEAAQFMPMQMDPMSIHSSPLNGYNQYWGMNHMGMSPMMGMSPNNLGMMNPIGMGMMYSLDTNDESNTDVDSAYFMMNPMIGGCASACGCRQRCAMVWWMPCSCGPCNGCGCCNDDNDGGNGGGGGGGGPVPEPEITTTTTEATTTPSCDRSCCSGCSCRPCTIWWMCPKPCAPNCCNGNNGCCNSPPTPPPSCCSCPTCVPWFPCQPCKCNNNCCPGSSCCSGSGCDKPEEKVKDKVLPPKAEDKKDEVKKEDKWDNGKEDKWDLEKEDKWDVKNDDKWDIKNDDRWEDNWGDVDDRWDGRWNDRIEDRIRDRWDERPIRIDERIRDRWDERPIRIDERIRDRWDERPIRIDERIRDRWDEIPVRIDERIDIDRLRDRNPPTRDIRLEDWEVKDILEKRDRRDQPLPPRSRL